MIGIISAMQEEIQAIITSLQNKKSSNKGMRTYYTGKLFDKEIVLVFSRWGKVASSTTVTQLINDFDISEIIFTGVGGSIHKNIHIGDIVIGKNLYQHDMNVYPILPLFEIPLLKKSSFETNKINRKKLQRASNKFLSNYSNYITTSEKHTFSILNPKTVIEDIASGDQFISTEQQINFIKMNLPTVGCVEMEGAAVAQVCYEYGIPFSIFRTISDKADDNSHIDFSLFAKEIASKYALEIIKYYVNM